MLTETIVRHNGKTYKFQRVTGEAHWDDGMYIFTLVDGVYKNGPVYPLTQGDAGLAKLLASGAEVVNA